MNEELLQLQVMCGAYSVLYAEDDAQTQESMAVILKRIFKTVYLAPNGAVGLEVFQEHTPDLVITDIQMPKMNGLDMAKAIKERAPKTPIIITTAFNEERYFLSAIENGIDSFLFKPIDKQKLFQTLTKTIRQIAYEAKAKELEALKKVEEINQASEESIQNLSNLFPFPALFYKDNTLIFVNTHARKTFEKVELDNISQETAFVSRFNLTKDKKQKIKLPTASGLNRIYWVYPNALFVGADLALVQAYIFMDVTVMEYQKIRLNAYSLPSLKKRQETQKAPQRESAQHTHAQNFIKTLSFDTMHTLDELLELQDFVVNFAYDYQANPHDSIRAKLAEVYLSYAKTLQCLEGFEELGNAVHSAANFLVKLHLDARKTQQLSLFLISLSEYVYEWYHTLFTTKSASDIHYLDDAILASCLQMESELSLDEHNTLGNDLELS